MTDPTDTSAPRPQLDPKPFEPGSTKSASGCQKPLLIGCGTLALLLGIGAIVFVMKAKDVLAFAMGRLQTEVVSHLPDETTAAERQRLEDGFSAAMQKIRSGEIDPAALQALQHQLTTAAQNAASRKLTTAEVRNLQKALDDFSGANAVPAPAGASEGESPGS
ncbi:MAG: hypothetical protein AB7G12_08450 [Thermoanaerobaculia bacterium]